MSPIAASKNTSLTIIHSLKNNSASKPRNKPPYTRRLSTFLASRIVSMYLYMLQKQPKEQNNQHLIRQQ